jgi:serine/threonine protein kinase
MSNCPSKKDLQRLLDDELPASMRGVVAEHVDRCLACQGELDALTTGWLGTNRQESAHDGIEDPTVSALVKRLCENPWVLAETTILDGDDFTFPGAPTVDAPLGTLGSYRIQERVAAGANGILYRAIDTELGRTVGIKVLRESVAASSVARTRLLREARAAATIKNDYVVSVLHVGSHPQFPPFLVLEFVEGVSLREKLDAESILQPREAAAIAHNAALGLLAAHRNGLVHRDVKPSNILLDQATGRARLTDFGLARSDHDGHRLTRDGAIAGTPAYMSVEQITDPLAVDGRTDVYGLGVVLYELLTGNLPFRGVLRMTVSQILHDEPIPPRRLNDAIPRDLETICLKAMAKNRDHRYASAAELAADLDAFIQGKSIAARPLTTMQMGLRWCRRNPVVAGLTAAVTSLLLLLTIVSTISAIRLSNAKQAATQHARQSREQLASALETLGRLVFDIQDKFDSEEVDLDELQTNVLQVVLDGLQRVGPTSDHSSLSALQLATAYRRLGEVLARTEGTKQADDYLNHASQLLEPIARAQPNNSEVLRQLAETELSRSDFYALDDDDKAAFHAKQGVEWSRQLYTLNANDNHAHHLLVDSLIAFGKSAQASGDSQGAMQAFEEALAQLPGNADPGQFDLVYGLSRLEALLGLARATEPLGNADAIIKNWNELLAETSAFQRQFPANVASNRFLFSALDGLQGIMLTLNRIDESRSFSQQAATWVDTLNKNSSAGPLYLDDIVSMYEQLAEDGLRNQNRPFANRNDQRRVDFLRFRIEQAPLDSHARHYLGLALLDQSESLLNQDDTRSALDRATEAVKLLAPLAQSADREPDLVESFAEALEQAEELSMLLGRDEEALSFRTQRNRILSHQSNVNLETKQGKRGEGDSRNPEPPPSQANKGTERKNAKEEGTN